MPRPQNPLDPESGPVAAFAVALRELRESAGTPSYRAMSKRSYYGFTTLAEAAAGRRFPNWDITRAYVVACGGDIGEWERRWKETDALLRRAGGTGTEESGERSPPHSAITPRSSGQPDPAFAERRGRLHSAGSGAEAARPEPFTGGSAAAPEIDPWNGFGRRGGPTVQRLLLGSQLRRLRETKGIPAEQAGYAIRASHSKISRMELGRVGFKERDVADLLTLYGVQDPVERASLLDLAREANTPGWWHRYGDVLPAWFETYLGLEEAASLLRTYESHFVPGLLQTEDYARAVVRLGHPSAGEEEIEQHVRVRLTRQQRLVASETQILWAVLDEAVLHRPISGPEVMRRQIAHLMEMAKLSNVVLQILPFARSSHTYASSAITVLRFVEHDLADIVYLEQLTSALYLDRETDVDVYTRVMNQASASALGPDESMRFLAGLLA
ncbi:helix-turn-helix domain-containing protein [Spirillospora sp. NPDC127200]